MLFHSRGRSGPAFPCHRCYQILDRYCWLWKQYSSCQSLTALVRRHHFGRNTVLRHAPFPNDINCKQERKYMWGSCLYTFVNCHRCRYRFCRIWEVDALDSIHVLFIALQMLNVKFHSVSLIDFSCRWADWSYTPSPNFFPSNRCCGFTAVLVLLARRLRWLSTVSSLSSPEQSLPLWKAFGLIWWPYPILQRFPSSTAERIAQYTIRTPHLSSSITHFVFTPSLLNITPPPRINLRTTVRSKVLLLVWCQTTGMFLLPPRVARFWLIKTNMHTCVRWAAPTPQLRGLHRSPNASPLPSFLLSCQSKSERSDWAFITTAKVYCEIYEWTFNRKCKTEFVISRA